MLTLQKCDDVVPLMTLNGDDNDGEDEIHFNNTKRAVLTASSRAKLYLTGGRRIWKFDRQRIQHRLAALVAILLFVTAVFLLFAFLVYPHLRPDDVEGTSNTTRHRHVFPWTTTYCSQGMTRLVEMCPCVTDISIRMQFKSATKGLLMHCIAECFNKEVNETADYEYGNAEETGEYLDDDDMGEDIDDDESDDNENADEDNGDEDNGDEDKGDEDNDGEDNEDENDEDIDDDEDNDGEDNDGEDIEDENDEDIDDDEDSGDEDSNGDDEDSSDEDSDEDDYTDDDSDDETADDNKKETTNKKQGEKHQRLEVKGGRKPVRRRRSV